ncbi:MAG: DUF2461 domain-containing protein [Pseudomonadota bacterium]
MAFSGLPKDYYDFFSELKENNNRAWFEENKPRFKQSVQEPLVELVVAMAPRLKRVSKYFTADPRLVGGSVFRIYRDVRFSKDKTPYKTFGAIHFRHARGKDAHAPGFYVHLDTDEVFFGGGIWVPPPPALLKIREAIREDPAAWKKASTGKAFVARFGGVTGDGLTRPPRGFEHDDPYIEDIKRKSFFAIANGTPSATRKGSFLDELEGTFRDTKPLMAFLCKALDAPF